MNGRELIAWNLRKFRTMRDLSQEKLAVDASIDRTYVGGLERGVENPTVRLLEQLAQALSIHISEFFRVPTAGETRPKPLRGGRRSTSKLRATGAKPRKRK